VRRLHKTATRHDTDPARAVSSVAASAVAVRAAGKRFDANVAVEDADLTVAPGEVRGLLGPNGAGKTTLLRMLLGLIAPDHGTIELFGQVVTGAGDAGREGVAGFVEMPCFYPYLSGRANLEVLAGFDSGDSATRIDVALERVGLGSRSRDRVSGYSTGMRQRLGIAAALIRLPRLLLLDEPTSGLDPASAREIALLVQSLASEGVAVLLSSHHIGQVEHICDTFTVLSRGRVVWEGTIAQLRAQAPPSAVRMRTSDDQLALAIAQRHPEIAINDDTEAGLRISGSQEAVDHLVLDIGRAGVAVRGLDLAASPLESIFFYLTDPPRTAGPMPEPTAVLR
jgi:ABC-2 type transport system ATP-binding protein